MDIDEIKRTVDFGQFFLPREKLADSVFRALRYLILTQRIKGGERLDYKELGDLLDVSRVPIREAVQHLKATGLLKVMNNTGTYTVKLSKKDIQDVCDLRIMLETKSLRNGIDRISSKELDRLERIFNEEADIQEWDPEYHTPESVKNADAALHNLIIESADSRIFSRVYLQIQDYILMLSNMNRREYISSKEHVDIIQAIRKKDVNQAVDLLETHLSSVCEKLLKDTEI